MAEIGLCIGYKLPLLKSTVYLLPSGQNPLPSNFPSTYLPIILKSIELDGWLTKKDVNNILEIFVDDIDSETVDFRHLESYWGEPFRTIRGYFYGKNFITSKKYDADNVVSYWIAPCFATLSIVMAIILSDRSLLIAWIDMLNEAQKRYIKNLVMVRTRRYWLCALENYDDLLALSSDLIAPSNMELKSRIRISRAYFADTDEEALIIFTRKNDIWIPKGKLKTINITGGPVVKSPSKISYLNLVFGQDSELVHSLLDELLNNMPLSVPVFISILKEYFNDIGKAGRIYSKMLTLRLIKIVQAHLYITEKGVKWYENYKKSNS